MLTIHSHGCMLMRQVVGQPVAGYGWIILEHCTEQWFVFILFFRFFGVLLSVLGIICYKLIMPLMQPALFIQFYYLGILQGCVKINAQTDQPESALGVYNIAYITCLKYIWFLYCKYTTSSLGIFGCSAEIQ